VRALFEVRFDTARRVRFLLASFLTLAIAAGVVIVTDGAFPPGGVLLAVLVAATTLEPADVTFVVIVEIALGITLAHSSGHIRGSDLVYRAIYYFVAAGFGIVLSMVRTNRERALLRSRRLNDLHNFTMRLFAEPDVDGIARVVSSDAAPLLDAVTARVMLVEDNRLVLAGAHDDPGASAGGMIAMSTESAATAAVRENCARYFPDLDAYRDAYPAWSAAIEAMGGNAVAFVPIHGNGSGAGVLSVLFGGARRFDDDERVTVEQVAHEIGVALERARLREQEQAAAVKLQQSLLGPPILVEGVGHEARYLPAEAALHVGGDWYNAQRLVDGRVGIAVGDVVGRGLEAATVMGQLRSALSAYADRSGTPAETLAHLDRFARQLPGATSTSVAFARVDIWGRTIEYACAGHPPPVLITPDGEACLLDDACGWPLAVVDGAPHERPSGARAFPAGSTILLYSDGLVERRDEALDCGLERLLAVVRRHWKLPLPLLCDALVSENLAGRRRADDVALLALRSPAANEHMLLLKDRATAPGLSKIRSALREWLALQRIGGDDAYALLVSVGEAAMNAVEHAYPEGGGLLRVEATMIDGEVVCCVTDTGKWHDNAARATRGNGLPIIRELMDDVVIDRRTTGTTVTVRYRPVSSVAA
jgi:serine phosphatase RsbU (regulator of sigma subunit)/anti-sigma regulatory factor (Ser/Thr protein kinase)